MHLILATSYQNLDFILNRSTENASILRIAKHALKDKLDETVDIEHGLDKHLTERNDASCDENVQIQIRRQRRCNKLNSGHTNSKLKNTNLPQTRKSSLKTKRSNFITFITLFDIITFYKLI